MPFYSINENNRTQSRHQTHLSTNAQSFDYECLAQLSWNLSQDLFPLSCSLLLKHFIVPYLTLLCWEDHIYGHPLKSMPSLRSLITANAFQWYGQPTVAVNCPKYNQVPLEKFMISVNMRQVIGSSYIIHSSFKPTFPSRLNTNLADSMHAIPKLVTLNDYSPPFQKFSQDSFATKWIIVC